jgi:hypothetical protein
MSDRWWTVPAVLLAFVLPADWLRANHTVPRGGQAEEAARDPYRIQSICVPRPAAERPPIAVSNGAELQQALDRANPGDTIALAAGATFLPAARENSFVLRNRGVATGQWITIRSADSAFDANGSVPPATRVSPRNQGAMPRIRATAANIPAIRAEARARGYRLIGLDIGIDPNVTQLGNLVDLGSDSNSIDTKPADIVIDRCYLHGNDTGNYRRGVALNGVRLAVIDSYFENFHDGNTDSQAIAGWSGPGPFKIVNNFLEAASENIMFGGSDPSIPGIVPSDIEVRGNVSTKRLSWRAAGVAVKNAFELKNARRVLVEGNVFENVWSSGQDGTAILLKSANQEGACTWCVTEYVTFRNNIVRSASHGLVINAAESGGARGLPLPVPANHIRIQNVLFTDIGGPNWGGGKLFRVFGGVSDVEITHVTSTSNANGILDPRSPSDLNPNLVFKYNIVERQYYGIGTGRDEGITTVTRNFTPYVYNQNVLVNTSRTTDQAITDAALKSRYPPVTTIAPDWKAVGFVSGSQRLAPTSPYYRAGEDGKDLGVDVDELTEAIEGKAQSYACGTAERPEPPPRRRPK